MMRCRPYQKEKVLLPFYQHTHSRAIGVGFIFTHEATVSHEVVVWSFFIMLFGRR